MLFRSTDCEPFYNGADLLTDQFYHPRLSEPVPVDHPSVNAPMHISLLFIAAVNAQRREFKLIGSAPPCGTHVPQSYIIV